MSILILELDTQLARSLEESARRKHKPLAEWTQEHLRLAALETEAEASGHPPGWLRFFGSVDDETFAAPNRSDVRSVGPGEAFDSVTESRSF